MYLADRYLQDNQATDLKRGVLTVPVSSPRRKPRAQSVNAGSCGMRPDDWHLTDDVNEYMLPDALLIHEARAQQSLLRHSVRRRQRSPHSVKIQWSEGDSQNGPDRFYAQASGPQ